MCALAWSVESGLAELCSLVPYRHKTGPAPITADVCFCLMGAEYPSECPTPSLPPSPSTPNPQTHTHTHTHTHGQKKCCWMQKLCLTPEDLFPFAHNRKHSKFTVATKCQWYWACTRFFRQTGFKCRTVFVFSSEQMYRLSRKM